MQWPFSRRHPRVTMREPEPMVRVLRSDAELTEAVARATQFERRISATVDLRLARYEEMTRPTLEPAPAEGAGELPAGDEELELPAVAGSLPAPQPALPASLPAKPDGPLRVVRA